MRFVPNQNPNVSLAERTYALGCPTLYTDLAEVANAQQAQEYRTSEIISPRDKTSIFSSTSSGTVRLCVAYYTYRNMHDPSRPYYVKQYLVPQEDGAANQKHQEIIDAVRKLIFTGDRGGGFHKAKIQPDGDLIYYLFEPTWSPSIGPMLDGGSFTAHLLPYTNSYSMREQQTMFLGLNTALITEISLPFQIPSAVLAPRPNIFVHGNFESGQFPALPPNVAFVFNVGDEQAVQYYSDATNQTLLTTFANFVASSTDSENIVSYSGNSIFLHTILSDMAQMCAGEADTGAKVTFHFFSNRTHSANQAPQMNAAPLQMSAQRQLRAATDAIQSIY